MFECPICHKDCNQLVIPPEGKLSCRACVSVGRKRYNVNLGQVVDTYTRKDGSTGKITVGKQIEIESRVTTPDGRVISKDNGGREARY